MKRLLIILVTLSCQCLAAADYISSEHLFSSSNIFGLQLSPDGRYLLGQSNEKSYRRVFVREVDTGKQREILAIPKKHRDTIRNVSWVDNDTIIASYFQNRSQLRFFDIFTTDSELKFNDAIISLKGGLVDALPESDNELLFAEFVSEDDGFRVYRATTGQILSGTTDKLAKLNSGVEKAGGYLSDEHHQLRMATVFEDGKRELFYRAKGQNKWRKFYQRQEKTEVFNPIAILDNDEVIALSNLGRDKVAVVQTNVNNLDDVNVLYESTEYDVYGADYDYSSGQLLWVSVVEFGVPTVKYLLDEAKNKRLKFSTKYPGKNVYRVSSSLGNEQNIYSVISEDSPRLFVYHDQQTNQHVELFADIPELSKFVFQKTITESIKADGDQRIEAFITLPNTKDASYPMVVMPHGGPIGVQDHKLFNRQVQFLANRGFAVLRVNFRGSEGYGKEFLQAGVSQWGKGIEQDINLAVEYITQKYPVDTNKMCIIGASYGGYSALMSSIKYPGKYQCVISSFGVTDLPLLFSASSLNQIKERKQSIVNVVGDVFSDLEQAKHNSPVYRAKELTTPLMIMAGENDKRAHTEHSYRLSYVLNKLNIPHEFLLYQNAGHGHVSRVGERHESIKTVEFLNKHLGINPDYKGNDRKQVADDLWFMSTQYRKEGVVDLPVQDKFNYIEQSAELGNKEALYKLGYYYHKGILVKQDLQRAFKLYASAAKKDQLQAILQVADAYKKGLFGQQKNNRSAYELYQKAHELKSFRGTMELANYLICQGKKDEAMANLMSLERVADDYSGFSVNEMKGKQKADLSCQQLQL